MKADGREAPLKKLHFVIVRHTAAGVLVGFSTTSATNKRADVQVGGSLGGLAAGIALKSLGHDTTILERNPTPLLHDQGAGIVAGGDALEFFKRYNRCKRPIAVSSQRRQYLDSDGNVVHKVDMVQNSSSVRRPFPPLPIFAVNVF